MSITRTAFGTADGVAVERYTLANASGVEAEIMTYGATLLALRTPDRNGTVGDILLGFETLDGYMTEQPYLGAVCGRYANRIARGHFELDGVEYTLAINNGLNHLHGGPGGFHCRVWQAEPRETPDGPALELRYVSADGEEGYPGNLSVRVVYTLTDANALQIDYTATTDQPTVLNLTNHSYFNLAGGGDVLGHEIEIAATRFVPVDSTLIPVGELRNVAGTPFDFTKSQPIGARIDAADEQIERGGGYDHCWVLADAPGELRFAARVYEPTSGRTLEVLTTEPGVQFYSGNFLDGTYTGKRGQVYEKRAGLCLETEHFPDSPNQPNFPTTVLRPGETYRHTTQFRVGVRE